MISQVVASERETAQTTLVTASVGLKDLHLVYKRNRNCLGRQAKGGESPVLVMFVYELES